MSIETTNEAPKLTTKHVAARFGIKTTHLRRILRSMEKYSDGIHTNYRWDPKDAKSMTEIENQIKAIAKKKADAKAAAQAKLAAKKEAEAKQAKVDSKA